MEEGAASPRRRLPTKASSGRIALPSACNANISPVNGLSADRDKGLSSANSDASSISNVQSTPSTSSRPDTPATTIEETVNSRGDGMAASAGPKTYTFGPPRPVPKPPPLKTGPLNSTSTPQAQSLPVKRRGSYQSLKRHTPSGINSEDEPSFIGLIKKATHWERFGTILVLGCLSSKTADGDAVLQMLLAEGYDTNVVDSQAEAIAAFSAREVFPDVVLIDSDHSAFDTVKLIRQLQAQNPTVAIICLASKAAKIDAVSALQAGAADFMYRPIDLDEMVARIERHVQRQHCIKLELETAMEDAKAMMAQLSTATALGDMMFNNKGARVSQSGGNGNGRLIAVAETDFEQQITDLSDENHKLGAKLQDMEARLEVKLHENRQLEEKLNRMEVKMFADSTGVQGQLTIVAEQNNALMHKVDALERIVCRHSQDFPRSSDGGC